MKLFLRSTAASLCCLAATAVAATSRPDGLEFPAPKSSGASSRPALGFKPNIIFILTDDQDTRLSGSNDTYDAFGSLHAMPKTMARFVEGGAHFSNAFVNTPICCPSRTEFFSGRYYHNIGPPNDIGGCMHVNTDNVARPEGVFAFLTAQGYNTGLFGKVTNDQADILQDLSQRGAVNVIDSPLDYNDFNGLRYFRLTADGQTHVETLDAKDPIFGTTYQTTQIGNRTLRWLHDAVNTTDSSGGRVPFFAYVGPHAPHFPATPAPWYEQAFPDLSIPLTPNYNLSCPDKPSHIAQNPPLSHLAKCWEDQHFRDRWRSLLSVDDLVDDIIDFLDEANVLNETFLFYSSDHGYKQGQWRVGTSKQHPYETDVRVPLLVTGPGIVAGSALPQIVGNLDITPTIMELAAGSNAIPSIVDGKSFLSYILPSLVDSAPNPRTAFLMEYLAVGTYFNDHSQCWDDNGKTEKMCGGPMPAGPDPQNPKPQNCKEQTNCTSCGNCYFVDSTLSNNWRMLRTIDISTGEDSSFIEYDPLWKWNVTDPTGAGLQHYEFYNNSVDPYQMVNTYHLLTVQQKTHYHARLAEYYACGGNNITASNCP